MKHILFVIMATIGCLAIAVGSGVTGMDHLFWLGISILICLWIITGIKKNGPEQQHSGPSNHLKR